MLFEKFIIAIPARMESSRLPNKLIANIEGKTMLQRVIEKCKKVNSISNIFLCTDNLKLKKIADNLEIDSILTSKSCESGSHRISTVIGFLIENTWDIKFKNNFKEINALLKKTVIINVQADQPFLNPDIISEMINFFKNSNSPLEVVTPVYKLKENSIHNPNVVKTLLNQNKEAIYFSRTALPYVRDLDKNLWCQKYNYWGHAGIYGYRADTLFSWDKLKSSPLENAEKLEQLRLIDNGISISTFEIDEESLSIDTMEQLKEARKLAKKLSPN